MCARPKQEKVAAILSSAREDDLSSFGGWSAYPSSLQPRCLVTAAHRSCFNFLMAQLCHLGANPESYFSDDSLVNAGAGAHSSLSEEESGAKFNNELYFLFFYSCACMYETTF